MNKFEIFDQFNNPKQIINGDFISVNLQQPNLELYIRFDELLNELVIVVHHEGKVLKEESIFFKNNIENETDIY